VTRVVHVIGGVVVACGVLAAADLAGATPDNARGCPPGWHALSTTPPESVPDPIALFDGDVEAFVWSNITKTEGFAEYMGLLDNNADGVLCVKWTWGDQLSERSSMRREFGELFDPLYHFILRDDTSAAVMES
jgi:hypothetical protein